MLTTVLVPIAPEGRIFVAIGVVVALALLWLGPWTGALGIALALWVAYFFRDPPRTVPTREGLVVSPADGIVSMITEAVPPAELGLGADVEAAVELPAAAPEGVATPAEAAGEDPLDRPHLRHGGARPLKQGKVLLEFGEVDLLQLGEEGVRGRRRALVGGADDAGDPGLACRHGLGVEGAETG